MLTSIVSTTQHLTLHLQAACNNTIYLQSATYQISHWRLLAVLFLHLHLHLSHWLGHSQGQLGLRLQLLLPAQEVHVLQGLGVVLGGVPVRVGRALLGLRTSQ